MTTLSPLPPDSLFMIATTIVLAIYSGSEITKLAGLHSPSMEKRTKPLSFSTSL
jgi:hypothetical protein